jgi:hypothetical protein
MIQHLFELGILLFLCPAKALPMSQNSNGVLPVIAKDVHEV